MAVGNNKQYAEREAPNTMIRPDRMSVCVCEVRRRGKRRRSGAKYFGGGPQKVFVRLPNKKISCISLPDATISSVPIYDFAMANEEFVTTMIISMLREEHLP